MKFYLIIPNCFSLLNHCYNLFWDCTWKIKDCKILLADRYSTSISYTIGGWRVHRIQISDQPELLLQLSVTRIVRTFQQNILALSQIPYKIIGNCPSLVKKHCLHLWWSVWIWDWTCLLPYLSAAPAPHFASAHPRVGQRAILHESSSFFDKFFFTMNRKINYSLLIVCLYRWFKLCIF